ncbi:zinc finger protein 570-like [Hemicordylus capensis]|uniref:zinc finger protein 570-like n=1 Tax=Hemicordylus capensis TaxID=884348 RepID=UPI002304A8F1|nr:zinc finger protein 570-like [Hemicordylus capensis]
MPCTGAGLPLSPEAPQALLLLGFRAAAGLPRLPLRASLSLGGSCSILPFWVGLLGILRSPDLGPEGAGGEVGAEAISTSCDNWKMKNGGKPSRGLLGGERQKKKNQKRLKPGAEGKSRRGSPASQHEIQHVMNQEREKIQCPPRRKGLSLEPSFEPHWEMHTEKKLCENLECGNGFSRGGALTLKPRNCTGAETYKCSVCGKSFSQCGYLTLHHRTYTGEKTYECLERGKKFSQSGNLMLHHRSHTGGKPHKCLVCRKSFSQHGYLT